MFAEADQRVSFLARHRLGSLPDSVRGFSDFYEARRRQMLEMLRGAALGQRTRDVVVISAATH